MSEKPDGIDVAIAAFFAARMCGDTTAEATRQAEAVLDFFGIEREAPATPKTYVRRNDDGSFSPTATPNDHDQPPS